MIRMAPGRHREDIRQSQEKPAAASVTKPSIDM